LTGSLLWRKNTQTGLSWRPEMMTIENNSGKAVGHCINKLTDVGQHRVSRRGWMWLWPPRGQALDRKTSDETHS
jgi:hypothetical protein